MSRALLVAAAAAAAVLVGCTPPPDTSLRPGPALYHYAPMDHPFDGARLAVDRGSAAAHWQRRTGADWIDPITHAPQARWVNGPADVEGAGEYARAAAQRDRLPVLVAYYVPDRGCAPGSGGAADGPAYLRWIDDLVAALGRSGSVIVLEPDAVSADCFDAARGDLLAEATRRLEGAGHHVYLDAGHPAWRSTGETAERLLRSGITEAEGFAVNVSNRQTTRSSFRWGRELSDLLGGREFVIDTSRNGLGPPRGQEWCNVQHQGLGLPPTTDPGLPGVAALLWIKRPGESDGPCGGEDGYGFSPEQARHLVENTPWVLPVPRSTTPAG